MPELAVETPQLVNNDETEEKRLEEEQRLIEQKVAGAAQFVQDGLSALSSGDSYLDNFMQEDLQVGSSCFRSSTGSRHELFLFCQ